MSDDQEPKSAVELAMARLRQKDRDAGIEERPLDDAQRARIAEARSVYAAKLAEREILHKSELERAGGDHAALETLEDQYRRDRERIASDRDRKIEEIRGG